MTQYRKKPVEVDAFQLTMHNRWSNADWPDWAHEAWNNGASEGGMWPSADPHHSRNPKHDSPNELAIGTLEGVDIVSIDDWIIKGVKGEISACKPDIFEATYNEI